MYMTTQISTGASQLLHRQLVTGCSIELATASGAPRACDDAGKWMMLLIYGPLVMIATYHLSYPGSHIYG